MPTQPYMPRRFRFFVASAITIGLTSTAVVMLHDRMPDAWNPWAPLRLEDNPNWLTRHKLQRASAERDTCRSVLEQAGWTYAAIEDETTAPGCGYRNAVRIERMQSDVGAAFTVSCRTALSLALWERHVLQPAAFHHFDAPVEKLEHFGSYACRSVYGRPNARMSNHATADALDVAGFVIDDNRIRIVSAWHKEDDEGAFVREIHKGACAFFDSVLGPDYNDAHRDHFHLDRGAFRVCK
jgi:hypothetical protein